MSRQKKDIVRNEAAFTLRDVESSLLNKRAVLESLEGEASYILRAAVNKAGIKIHDIDGRVKSADSIFQKCLDKSIENPFEELSDIVGVRVITLFRSDMAVIEKIIKENFTVISTDDKVSESQDTFGYMSVHYVCHLRNEYTGPRYNDLKGIKLEIQVRTLCMHAWAAVSHYLSYKGNWDVPNELKKSLNALSGLFYVADNEFEQAFKSRAASAADAVVNANSDLPSITEVNLDTVTAMLRDLYPDRKRSGANSVSDLVKELVNAGYRSVEEVRGDLRASSKAFLSYESDTRESPYADVGVVRVSLTIASEAFRRAREYQMDWSPYLKYANLIDVTERA